MENELNTEKGIEDDRNSYINAMMSQLEQKTNQVGDFLSATK